MRCSTRHFLGCVLSICAACSPGPQGGGQTGDPGVTDFLSLDPELPDIVVEGADCPRGVTGLWLDRGGLLDTAPRWRALDPQHVVLFEPMRGLSIADVSGDAPRLVARWPLPAGAGELHIVGARALIARRSLTKYRWSFEAADPTPDEDAELVALDLSDPSKPTLIDTIPLQEAPRFSHAFESAGHTFIALLSDGGTADGCVDRLTTKRLVRYELGAAELTQRGALDLGVSAAQVVALDQHLGLVRGSVEENTLSLIALSTEAMLEGAPKSLPGMLTAARLIDASTLRVAYHDIDPALFSVVRLEDYDLRDTGPWMPRHQCTVSQLVGSRVTLGEKHSLLTTDGAFGTTAVTSVVHPPEGSCRVETVRNDELKLIESPFGGAVRVELDADGSIVAHLLSAADLSPVASASSPVFASRLGTTTAIRGTFTLPEGRSAEGLIAVQFDVPDDAAHQPGMALFSVTPDGIEARGTLPAATLLPNAAGGALTFGAEGLARLDLTEEGAPRSGAASDLAPAYTRIWSFGALSVRLRSPAGADAETRDFGRFPGYATLALQGSAWLELIDADADADAAPVLDSIEVPADARFAQVGSRLVSFAPDGGTATEGPFRVDVYEVSAPQRLARVGGLRVAELSLPANRDARDGWSDSQPDVSGGYCLDCPNSDLEQRTLPLPDALVLWGADDALRVLDLRDPTRPALSAALPLPDAEPLRALRLDGTSLYYAYAKPGPESDDGTPQAHFYVRRVDLTDPSRAQIGAARQVPGQLVAVSGEALYTRELVSGTEGRELLLHRLSLHGVHGVRVEATHSFGRRAARAIELDGDGHLLIDVDETLEGFDVIVHLRVLDAQTLELRGEARIGADARRLGRSAGRAVYTSLSGYMLMQLDASAAPTRVGYWPDSWRRGPARALLSEEHIVLHDQSVLFSYPADSANLPEGS